MDINAIQMNVVSVLRMSFSSFHRFLITLSCVTSLFFSLTWFHIIGRGVWAGQSHAVINFGFLGLGLYALWREKAELTKRVASEADQFLGDGLALCGILIFPFVRSSASLQAVMFAWICLSLALSHWGIQFFRRRLGVIVMLLIASYPDLQYIAVRIFWLLTPEMGLERLMAWMGKLGLLAIGQKAVAQGQYLSLPEGSVEVNPGCSGFSMAFTLAGCSLLLGLFFKLKPLQTSCLLLIGILIALLFNVPRIMLLANAAVYWGEDSFYFWHDSWGGQIFSTIMFTAYYYAVMPFLAEKKSS